jgi:hypothetical protein
LFLNLRDLRSSLNSAKWDFIYLFKKNNVIELCDANSGKHKFSMQCALIQMTLLHFPYSLFLYLHALILN